MMVHRMGCVLALALLAALAGCATVEGVGRDISGGANRVNGWING